MPKASKVQHRERIDYIIELITIGVTQRADILQFVTKRYKIKDSQVDKDMKIAREKILELNKPDREEMIARSKMRYLALFNKAWTMQDYRECRMIQGDIDKLFGLQDKQKVDVTTNGESLNVMTPIILSTKKK